MLTGISLVSFAEDGKTLPSAEINGITYTAVADADGNATSEACVSEAVSAEPPPYSPP